MFVLCVTPLSRVNSAFRSKSRVKICRYVDVGYLNGKIDNLSDILDTSTINYYITMKLL